MGGSPIFSAGTYCEMPRLEHSLDVPPWGHAKVEMCRSVHIEMGYVISAGYPPFLRRLVTITALPALPHHIIVFTIGSLTS